MTTAAPASELASPRISGAGSLVAACAALFLWTAPGRINFPDDEIVFQTTASLWTRGSLAIEGISRRTGEPRERPTGTFGWAPGPDGARYGFFGHGPSLVALPLYALGAATAQDVPFAWTRAVRSDHYAFHAREPVGDWTRLLVSLTNCFVTAAAVGVLVRWLDRLGFSARAALWTGVAYAVGTSAWPYTRTLLSEPLSALCLLLAALAIAEAHARRGQAGAARWMWLTGALAGFSLHVHVLNAVAWPCLLGYALGPALQAGRRASAGRVAAAVAALRADRRGWIGALALAGLGLGLLLLGQYLRFGDPLETGRFGHYSRWVAPWEGLAAQLVGPGRSFWLYSPALILAALGWPALRRRLPLAAGFALALVAARWLVISGRSDWFGGWGLGPRHLVPVIPFALLGFAAAVEELPRRRPWVRRLFWFGLAAAAALMALMATRSIFEWMWTLMRDPRLEDRPYFEASHWAAWASPLAGFPTLKPDVLALGAIRIAQLGHPGLLVGFAAIALLGVAAAARVAAVLWRLRVRTGP